MLGGCSRLGVGGMSSVGDRECDFTKSAKVGDERVENLDSESLRRLAIEGRLLIDCLQLGGSGRDLSRGDIGGDASKVDGGAGI